MARNVDPVQDFVDTWVSKNSKDKKLAEIEFLGELAMKYDFVVVDWGAYEMLVCVYREKWHADRGEIDPAIENEN